MENQKPRMGRPPKTLDWEIVEKLAAMHCTKKEIADWFDMSCDTLATKVLEEYGQTFSVWLKGKASLGKVSLRRHLWSQAEKGNTGVLIWMSKQHLGMSERVTTVQEMERLEVTSLVEDVKALEAPELAAEYRKLSEVG